MIRKPFTGIGTILLLTMLMIVTMVVFTLLNVLNVKLQSKFVERKVTAMQEYYSLENQAQLELAKIRVMIKDKNLKALSDLYLIDEGSPYYRLSYEVNDQQQALVVSIEFKLGENPKIVRWQLVK
jgi:hypothetical protein